jgi:hypothetical protein
VRGIVGELQPAVTIHGVRDVDEQRVRHRVTREPQQRVDHAFGVVTSGARVPQAQRGQPVGVDVLGGALELGERRDRHAAGGRLGMVDLEQERLVGLDDQRAIGHAVQCGTRPRQSQDAGKGTTESVELAVRDRKIRGRPAT